MPDFSDALTSDLIADIVFSVDGESILAHKFILYFRSPVFATMFNGPMAPKSENGEKPVIEIEDVRINATDFKTFLNYLYSDKVEITGDNAFPLLNMAKMYDVDSLFKLCEEFLITKLDRENLVTVANSASVFHDSEIFKKTINFISANPDFLMSEKFCQMNAEVLSEVLKKDEIKLRYPFLICHPDYIKNRYCSYCGNLYFALLSEIELFQVLLKWGENQCKIQNLEKNPENMKNILKELLRFIRFPTMTVEELTTIVYPSKLLDDSTFALTIVAAQNFINGRTENSSPFSNVKRQFY